MKKIFRVLLVAYLVTSPILILFLIYKTVFLTKKIFDLQNDFLTRNTVETYPVEALYTEDTPFLGSPNARVKILWYTDVDCSACQGSFQNISDLLNAYPEEIVVYFKFLPSENKTHQLAHQLLLHAWEKGQFFDIANLFFSDKSARQPSAVAQLKDEIGFPDEESETVASYDMALTQNLSEFRALGTYATPTFVVNGKVWSGSNKARLLTEIQAVPAPK